MFEFQKIEIGSRKSHFHVFTFLPFFDRQTDGQNIYITEKKIDVMLYVVLDAHLMLS